jgi:transposase
MTGISRLLDKSSEQKANQALKSLGKNGEVANKLKAIIATKDHSVSMVADIFNVTRATLTKWIKAFVQNDHLALIPKSKSPRGSKLSTEQMGVVEEWVGAASSITIRALREKILHEFGVTLSMSTAHRIMQRLKFSYITPRPRHNKQDPLLQAEFKKKSTNHSKS